MRTIYNHLVFDIDGTMVDTAMLNSISLQRVVKELKGIDLPLEETFFSFGIPTVKALTMLEFENPAEDVQAWHRHYAQCIEEMGVKLFPGIRDVLEALHEKPVKLGIITSRSKEEYLHDAKENNYEKYFDVVITADDTKRGKPYPDPMEKYMERTGAKPEEVLYFGDTLYDMKCAQSSGVDFALVLWGCLNPEGLEPTYRLEKPEDILQFV